jgi:hypothetical protein
MRTVEDSLAALADVATSLRLAVGELDHKTSKLRPSNMCRACDPDEKCSGIRIVDQIDAIRIDVRSWVSQIEAITNELAISPIENVCPSSSPKP